MQERSGAPRMSPDEHDRPHSGLSVDLLVRDVAAALEFQREVLGATVAYSDDDCAIVRCAESEWRLHADRAYAGHPLGEIVELVVRRGAGVELRLHGVDPDRAERRARERGHPVLAGARDTSRGMREAYLVDRDGYVWVVDVPLKR